MFSKRSVETPRLIMITTHTNMIYIYIHNDNNKALLFECFVEET